MTEADCEEDGSLYVVIHSGSRHLEKEVAEYYLNQGQRILKEQGIDIPYELTYLEGSLMEDYLHDQCVVQSFASQNRAAMLDELVKGMKLKVEEEYSCVHNYIEIGTDYKMLRKGAISAKSVEKVVIPINMQVLFNVLMGLRRQEINAVKYSDVDYINRTLSVERQLGKELNRESYGVDEKPATKKELPLKTMSSRRILPIPDYVFEAILQERKVYEQNRSRNGKRFLDADYICCSTYGKPRSKDFHWSHYKKLLQDAGLPDIRWHDLRSTYCTLLLKSDFNPKAVSELMGHAKEIITMDVYGDNANIIPEEIPELLSYMEKVMPNREEPEDDDISKIEIDVSRFLKENKSAGCDKDSD
ncbi:MAG: RtcB family protein [Lachnospiraceae bacterium]|nr:RtcB family protein [Lachnospiraceae bacterium]